MTAILGISGYYHDSAACLVRDGEIVAAAQEERFTRKKHDPGFPHRAIEYFLKAGGIRFRNVEHLLETYLAFAPTGLQSFLAAMPVWIKEKLFLKSLMRDEFLKHGEGMTKKKLFSLLFSEHHESHAASAFYPSPYDSAAVLCIDGAGE
jgi:carbamoyltransferase